MGVDRLARGRQQPFYHALFVHLPITYLVSDTDFVFLQSNRWDHPLRSRRKHRSGKTRERRRIEFARGKILQEIF